MLPERGLRRYHVCGSIFPKTCHFHPASGDGKRPLERWTNPLEGWAKPPKVEENVRKPWTPSFGRNVRTLRDLKKLTQVALAKDAKVTVDTVRNWEGGPNAPTPQHVDALARIFGVSVEILWERAVVLVPEFDVGVHCFPAPPVVARESLVVEPIMRKLRAQDFDRYAFDNFDNLRTALKEQLPSLYGQQIPEYKARLLEWAKAKKRALVLSAFRPRADDEWSAYIDFVGFLKYDCCIVVVQSIDPFHAQTLLKTTSRYAAKVYPVDMSISDFPIDPENLRREVPTCCYRTILAVLHGNFEWDGRECVAKLIEAKIMAREGNHLVFQSGSEPLWRRVVEQ